MSELEEMLKDPNSLAFLVYKAIEGATNAAEELKMGKNTGIYETKFSKNFIEDAFNLLMKKYTDGSVKKKIFLNAVMSLPWSDAVKLAYDVLLDLGKNEDGSYKNTKDTLLSNLEKYLGE